MKVRMNLSCRGEASGGARSGRPWGKKIPAEDPLFRRAGCPGYIELILL
jgi:hypothetical protein